MQPVSGVLSTQKARTPGCDSQHLYTGEGLLTLLDTASAEASCASAASSSELSTCSTRLAVWRRFCWSPVVGLKMWLAQILARCPVLLQFRQTISADTLHSLTEWPCYHTACTSRGRMLPRARACSVRPWGAYSWMVLRVGFSGWTSGGSSGQRMPARCFAPRIAWNGPTPAPPCV